jgi:hypothetical protein
MRLSSLVFILALAALCNSATADDVVMMPVLSPDDTSVVDSVATAPLSSPVGPMMVESVAPVAVKAEPASSAPIASQTSTPSDLKLSPVSSPTVDIPQTSSPEIPPVIKLSDDKPDAAPLPKSQMMGPSVFSPPKVSHNMGPAKDQAVIKPPSTEGMKMSKAKIPMGMAGLNTKQPAKGNADNLNSQFESGLTNLKVGTKAPFRIGGMSDIDKASHKNGSKDEDENDMKLRVTQNVKESKASPIGGVRMGPMKGGMESNSDDHQNEGFWARRGLTSSSRKFRSILRGQV